MTIRRTTWRASAAGLFALALLAPGEVRASRSFSDVIATELGTGRIPACTVCHDRAESGVAVPTPFSSALAARGFDRREADSIGPALIALEVDGVDSDGDGVGDVAELRDARDPNAVDGAGGCSVGVTGRGGSVPSLVLVVVLGLLARRARHP